MSDEKYLRAGTVLVPKPEWLEFYKKINWTTHTVTEKEEKQNATIGDRWMIKQTGLQLKKP